MSKTYYILCDACRVKLWIGQAPYDKPHRFYIYTRGGGTADVSSEQYMPLAEFFMMHQAHPLRFISSSEEGDTELEYLNLEDKPGLPVQADEEQPGWLEPDELEAKKMHYAANVERITE